jgi:Holliday junction resolvasome RuvABC endonuclease subunit
MSQPRLINVCGMDPSMRSWGIACGTYNLDTHEVVITHVEVVNTESTKSKQVRTNSLDIARAVLLYEGAEDFFRVAQFTFVEVPVGSQSANGMKAYGMCVGILGSVRASGSQFIEVTPTEVKVAATGNKNATKDDMIEWATTKHPEAPWSKHHGKLNTSKVEHQADAVGAIHAGIKSNAFKQLLPYLAANKGVAHAS